METDKRRGTRVLFRVKAKLTYNGEVVRGQVVNLSLKGMLVFTEHLVPEGTEVAISIYLSGTTSQLTLAMRGTVVRCAESTIAIQFKEIDVDSFIHLRSVVAYNEGDEEKIMQEFYDFVHTKK